MYTIQTMECTGPTNMNHIPTPHERPPVAGPWFIHTVKTPGGYVQLSGVAREIWVSEAGFRRFFEIPDDDHLEGWWMVINKSLSETVDVVGKVFNRNSRQPRFQILFIDHSHGALLGHAVRTTVPKEINECN
jgi:hypothetical protein